jgi:anti-sigma28 factor (negative regulator of flagellin synthesis)
MSDIPPISGSGVPGGPLPPRESEGGDGVKRGPASPPAAGDEDQVEISEVGQLLSTLEIEGDIRIDRVMEIREAIANGTYETEAKLEYTISRLMETLRSPGE